MTERSKHALRREAFTLRQATPSDLQHTINNKVVATLKTLFEAHPIKRLALFYPLPHELDLRVFDHTYETFYPVIEEGKLTFAPWCKTFKQAPFNTRVPDTPQRDDGPFDAMLVPGLMFSKDGYRLGYGKGYYDQFLKGYQGLTIGVCDHRLLKATLPTEPHDMRVDHIVTDQGHYVRKPR